VDEDVKLAVEQEHTKWLVRRAVMLALGLFAVIGFWVHDCNVTEERVPCREAMIRPDVYASVIRCPDPRQVLTWPQGWTWGKCSCPVLDFDGK
jgi:hypothetical protein